MTVPTRPVAVLPVSLSALARVAGALDPVPGASVTGITHRSASVVAGDLFAALPGGRTHGARFCAAARDAGAVAVLTDEAGAEVAREAGLPVLVVPDPRAVLGAVSAAVYGDPGRALTLIGVTGTQGKTTTTHLLAGALAAAGRRTAVVGTLGTFVEGEPVKTPLTTPEAPDLHAMFAVMRERDVEVCALEVSSHALVLGRVDGVVFDVGVFLNIGRDHLDFHGDMEHYLAAKASLLTPERARRAVVNADDPVVSGLVGDLRIPVATFSPAGNPEADWRAEQVRPGVTGSSFRLTGPAGLEVAVSLPLAGAFNVANAVAALAAAGEAGFDVPATAAGLARVGTVSGRLERIEEGQPFAVVVDYAHKPEALTAVLSTLRPLTAGRLWVVLGAGGDRDRGKRQLMGEAAARLADVVVVTDDNPRWEDPAAIRAAVLAGARGTAAEVAEIPGRRDAIGAAIGRARPGDTVLIAGKGHESGQEVAGRVLDFDDRAVAREVLAQTWAGRRVS